MKRILSLILSITCFVTIVTVPIKGTAAVLSDKTLNGWQFSVNEDSATGKRPLVNFEIDTEVKASGANSLKISYLESEIMGPSARANIWLGGLVQGKRYRLGYKVKAENASNVAITLDSVPGFGWSNFTKNYGTTFDWKEVELEFLYAKPDANCRYVIEIRGLCDGIWFDDFYCYEYDGKKTIGKNLAQNPGIEVLTGCTLQTIGAAQKTGAAQFDVTKTAMLQRADNIKIDGKLDDWQNVAEYEISSYYSLVAEASQSMEGTFKYAFDDSYYYIAAAVEDDVFCGTLDESGYWNYDSFQAAWADEGGAYKQIAVFCNNGSVKTVGLPEGAEAAVTQSGNKTYYEVKIPWKAYFKDIPEILNINILVNDNDNDGYGRRGWLEVTDGIGTSKNVDFFADWYTQGGFFTVDAEAAEKGFCQSEEAKVNINISNFNSEAKTFNIAVNGETAEIVSVPAISAYTCVYDAKVKEIGYYNLKIDVTDTESGVAETVSMDITRCPTKAESAQYQELCEGYAAELKALVEKCEKKGLSIRYEKARCTLVKIFAERIGIEAEKGNFDRVTEYIDAVKEFYTETKQKLNAYLDGSEKPIEVPDYVYSNVKLKDGRFYGYKQTENGLEEVPVMLVGGNTFYSSIDVIKQAYDLGFNFFEYGIYDVVLFDWVNGTLQPDDSDTDGYHAWLHPVPQIKDFLKAAKDNNITFKVGMSAMGVLDQGEPKNIYYDTVDVNNHTSTFMKYVITHPLLEEVLDEAYKGYAEKILPGYEDVICAYDLSNEPNYRVWDKVYYREFWFEYLVERFDNDINKLNECYGTNYEKFSDCDMPSLEYTPLYQDFRQFSEGIMQQHLKTEVDLFKKYVPDADTSPKQMMTVAYNNYENARYYGTNYEKNEALFEYNNCDTFFWGYEEKHHINELLWYDYMYSCDPVALANSEEHLIPDQSETGKIDYDRKIDDWTRAGIWQALVHNVQMHAIWNFADLEGTSHINPSMYNRPRTFDMVSRTALDAQRLTEELVMLQERKPEVAMLWSDSSYNYNPSFHNSVNKGYYTFFFNGLKTHCLTESKLETLDDYNFLLVPHSTHVTKETLAAIEKFVKRGGTLVLLGDDCLAKDEYDRNHDKAIVDAIKKNAVIYDAEVSNGTILDVPESFYADMQKLLTEEGYIKAMVIDKNTGKKAEHVSWDYVEKDGRKLLNINVTGWDTAIDAEIYINGVKQGEMYDLLNNHTYNGAVSLKPYEPVLLELGKGAAEHKKDEITVEINGEKLGFDVAPVMESDRVLVPMRAIFEALGAKVDWKDATQTATGTTESTVVSVTVDTPVLVKNGEKVTLDVPARLKNGRTLVPVRAVSEAFNCQVEWNNKTQTVEIVKN